MLKLSKNTFDGMERLAHATFAPASMSPQASYTLAANDHAGITGRFGLSAQLPPPDAANAPTLQFANLA